MSYALLLQYHQALAAYWLQVEQVKHIYIHDQLVKLLKNGSADLKKKKFLKLPVSICLS